MGTTAIGSHGTTPDASTGQTSAAIAAATQRTCGRTPMRRATVRRQ
jgi:hypothetical protein